MKINISKVTHNSGELNIFFELGDSYNIEQVTFGLFQFEDIIMREFQFVIQHIYKSSNIARTLLLVKKFINTNTISIYPINVMYDIKYDVYSTKYENTLNGVRNLQELLGICLKNKIKSDRLTKEKYGQ